MNKTKKIIIQSAICFTAGYLIGYFFIPMLGLWKSLVLAVGVGLLTKVMLDWIEERVRK